MANTAFLFPGQGAQTVGMGAAARECPAAKALFDRAAEILGYDLLQVCLEGPSTRLDATVVSQPALYVAGLAAVEILRQTKPDAIASAQAAAGLSLGEYTALAFAGVFSFEDGLRIVKVRGESMQAAADATPSGMVSVLGLDAEAVVALCKQVESSGRIWPANYLCPGNIATSGELAACEALMAAGEAAGATKTIRLAVAGAFHTPIMQPAVAPLTAALASVDFKTPSLPVYSNVDATSHSDPGEIRELLIRQACEPVRWEDSIRNMMAAGIDEFYELGPGRVLAGLLKRVSRRTPVENVGV